jgi:DnaJ-domain-containing protein 1
VILPGRLSRSTLGDLLGALHRHRITGVVELSEIAPSAAAANRPHRIAMAEGLVAEVDTPLGRRTSLRDRLEALFQLDDAWIRFRIGRVTSTFAALSPREFLHGRPRSRDRNAPRPPAAPARAAALRVLGLPAHATADEARRAFRKLAMENHPDRHPHASAEEKQRLGARLAEVCAAYRALA